MSQRTQRVGDLIRRELASVIVKGLQDPRVRLATVSDVRVTPDLRRAVVRVSILGDDEERRAGIEGLQHARGFLRSTLARRLKSMRAIPELVFAIRPEDINAQDISDGDDNLIEVEIKHLEFLGSFYRADLGGGAISDLGMRADFSINLVRRKGVQVGSRLPVRLPPQFIRVYPGD